MNPPCSLPVEDTKRGWPSANQEGGPYHSLFAGALILGFPAARTVRNKCYLSHLVCGHLLELPEQTEILLPSMHSKAPLPQFCYPEKDGFSLRVFSGCPTTAFCHDTVLWLVLTWGQEQKRRKKNMDFPQCSGSHVLIFSVFWLEFLLPLSAAQIPH